MFFGLAGGVGYYFSTFQNFDGYYDYPTNTYELQEDGSTRKNNNFQIGFSPVFGADFKLGSKYKGSVIGISLAYESWYRNVRDFDFTNTDGGYSGFSIITSYRYNLSK